jgi:drug/metabolite transporter (DMT)-like permease
MKTGTAKQTESSRAHVGLLVALLAMSVGPSILRTAESTGLTFAAWRMLAGAAGYFLYLWLRGGSVTGASLRSALPGGIFFGGELAMGYAAFANTSIANVVVILALRPAAVMMFAWPIFREKVHPRTIIWTAIAIAGVAIAVFGAGETAARSLKGDLLAIGAMMVSSGYLMMSKHVRSSYDAMTYSTSMMMVAAVMLAPIAIIVDGGVKPPPAEDWIWIMAMVILPGAGHVLTNYAHGHIKLTLLASMFLVLPGTSTLVAWVLVDEVVKPAHLIGMAVTLGALAMVVLRDQSPARQSP